MVARRGDRLVKWRYRCATCGVVFLKRRRWAYCSKACETGRLGIEGRRQARKSAMDEVDEYLRLAVKLESVPVSACAERAELQARMAELIQPEVAPMHEAAVRQIQAAPHSVQEWLGVIGFEWDRFESTMRKSLAAAIQLGRRLNEAKAALDHGEFGRLFADHERPVRGAMRFTSRWAQKLMAIAENPVIANPNHGSDLPPDLNSVYHLSRIPAEALEDAIARGAVRYLMRREDARKLLAGPPSREPSDEDLLVECLQAVRRPIATFASGHPALFGDLAARLRAILRDVGRQAMAGATA